MTNSKIYQPASCGILRFYFILKKAIQERLINSMLARVIYFSKSIEVTFDTKFGSMLELSTVLPTAMLQNFVEHQEHPHPLHKRMIVCIPVTSLVTMHHCDHQNSHVNINKLTKASWSGLLYSPCVA